MDLDRLFRTRLMIFQDSFILPWCKVIFSEECYLLSSLLSLFILFLTCLEELKSSWELYLTAAFFSLSLLFIRHLRSYLIQRQCFSETCKDLNGTCLSIVNENKVLHFLKSTFTSSVLLRAPFHQILQATARIAFSAKCFID